jgi:DNA helicase-2/ATP-dependent DNA helicase PcrA
VHAQNRSAYGYAEPVEPSRFLEDIPQEMLEQTRPARQKRRASFSSPATYRPERWAPSGNGEADRQPVISRYSPGMRVLHPSWGEGMVLNSRLQDDDEIVDIFFETYGLKRVAASLARLEIKT